MNCAPIRDIDHKGRLQAKEDRVEALKALLKMHEDNGEMDMRYIQGLRRRLRLAINQRRNMRP